MQTVSQKVLEKKDEQLMQMQTDAKEANEQHRLEVLKREEKRAMKKLNLTKVMLQ
jgi:hypothetical protein